MVFGKINDGGVDSAASRKQYQDISLDRCSKKERDKIDSKGTR